LRNAGSGRCGFALRQPQRHALHRQISDSVIEHVPDPAATVERLAQAVAPGGLLYLIIDAHEVSPAFPMHQHVQDLLAAAPTLRALQHVKHDGDLVNAFRRPR